MNQEQIEEYGLHQTLDCYKCSEQALDDDQLIYDFLNNFPAKIGMKKICEPNLVRVGATTEKDPGGVSGIVMISESHISIHTYPKRQFFTMDVYSCNRFDTELVKTIVRKTFGVGIFEENVVVRGKYFKKLATLVPSSKPTQKTKMIKARA